MIRGRNRGLLLALEERVGTRTSSLVITILPTRCTTVVTQFGESERKTVNFYSEICDRRIPMFTGVAIARSARLKATALSQIVW